MMFDDVASMAVFALEFFKEDYRKKFHMSKEDRKFLDIIDENAKYIKNPHNRKAYAETVREWIENHTYIDE